MTPSVTRAMVLVASICCGCSARVACEEGLDSDGLELSSDVHTASTVLSSAGDGQVTRYRATLSGLPELWQADSAVLSAAATVHVALSYQNEPKGSDGRTEMPRIAVTFAPSDAHYHDGPSETPSFPTEQGTTFSTPLFQDCMDESDANCCPYGARECTADMSVGLQRIEGAPFPPVVVAVDTSAAARVSTCPLGRAEPSLSLEALSP